MPRTPSHCTLINGRTRAPLCAEVRMARTFFTRLIGLLAHRELPHESGLWIEPSNGIHTLGMRFNIDVVAFDRNGAVLKFVENVRPWRILTMPRKTRSVLELPAGHLSLYPVQVGDLAFPTYTATHDRRSAKAPQAAHLLAVPPMAHTAY